MMLMLRRASGYGFRPRSRSGYGCRVRERDRRRFCARGKLKEDRNRWKKSRAWCLDSPSGLNLAMPARICRRNLFFPHARARAPPPHARTHASPRTRTRAHAHTQTRKLSLSLSLSHVLRVQSGKTWKTTKKSSTKRTTAMTKSRTGN